MNEKPITHTVFEISEVGGWIKIEGFDNMFSAAAFAALSWTEGRHLVVMNPENKVIMSTDSPVLQKALMEHSAKNKEALI